MECFLTYIFDKLWPIFVAVTTTLWINQKFVENRKPKLEMVPEEIKTTHWFEKMQDGSVRDIEFKVWRIIVKHIHISYPLSWFIKHRESAIHCKAEINFLNNDGKLLFNMQGRWSNTKQIPFLSPSNQQEKIIYPDTIDIEYHSPQPLDCFVKFHDDENNIYGWNNESYVTRAKNPRCKLPLGKYKVEVILSGQNFRSFSAMYNLNVSKEMKGIKLTPT